MTWSAPRLRTTSRLRRLATPVTSAPRCLASWTAKRPTHAEQQAPRQHRQWWEVGRAQAEIAGGHRSGVDFDEDVARADGGAGDVAKLEHLGGSVDRRDGGFHRLFHAASLGSFLAIRNCRGTYWCYALMHGMAIGAVRLEP